MERFKDILYLVDLASVEDQRGDDKIAHLARTNGAKVTMMHVEETTPIQEIGKFLSEQFETIQRELKQYHQRELDNIANNDHWRGVNVETYISQGRDFIEIIKKVLRDGHDLVIKEERLEKGIDQLSMRLVRKCPSPVWFIKRGNYSFGRVLAALDVERDSLETFQLNKKIIELSNSLSQRENGEAFYMHAWRLESEMMLSSSRFNFSTADIKKIKESMIKDRYAKIGKLFSTCRLTPHENQIFVMEGESDDMITAMVERLGIDVLVMGSVGRVGIPGLLIGNRAEKLLNHINCTVLTVKPEGFLSPVKPD